jgi:hypothetical protein
MMTTLAAISATILRRFKNLDTGVWGDWEVVADNVAPDATVIDTTAGIAGDVEYKVVTHSAAPSSVEGEPLATLAEERWLYVSTGAAFDQICRMYGNIELKSTATRDRALYNFAGRTKPVLFLGEATGLVVDVAGLLDDESSTPAEWERLAQTGGVVLLRDPLGRRIYGSMEQVELERLNNGLYSIAFTITEVDYP